MAKVILKLDDETDSDLETEPENHINSDDSESTTESSDEDETSANAAGQNLLILKIKLSQVMMNRWLGKSQKIPFHQQLQKMFTAGAGEYRLAIST